MEPRALARAPWRTLVCLIIALSQSPLVMAESDPQTAETAFAEGLAHQKERRTEAAISAYQRALQFNPDHARAHYELGWSYWTQSRWQLVIEHWKRARALGLAEPALARYLKEAQDNLKGIAEGLVRAPIGARAQAAGQPGERLTIELAARFQHYNSAPSSTSDHYDPYMFSPKSARFSHDGTKVYVNALEGLATIIYDPVRLKRIGLIKHRFGASNAHLFTDRPAYPWLAMPKEAPPQPDHFNGKPVESALSHQGRYLWVPYYRRDYDKLSTMPSAVALIDTRSDKILRVMATGPIPKYVVASPTHEWLAVAHWGDNTVGLIDTRADNPADYAHAKLITIGYRVNLSRISSKDRDHGCGYCLRGSVFTRDGKYLLVARMGGGGIAVIDMETQRYIGTVFGMRPTPRHLELSADGTRLYMSLSFAGYVAWVRTEDVIAAVRAGRKTLAPAAEGQSGRATRTIALSPDGRVVYAAVNRESRIVALDADTLKPLTSIVTDSYPVGMAISPDGSQLWVTAQGRKGRGGNSLTVYRISRQ